MATLEKIPNGQSASVSSTKNENDTGNSQEKYDFLQNSLVAEGESNEVHLNNLEKHFDIFSTLGDSYSATSTPITIGTYLSLVVGVGGSPVFFFGYILCMIFNMCVCLCMAEMSSIFPHSSGTSILTDIFLVILIFFDQARYFGRQSYLLSVCLVGSATLWVGGQAQVGSCGMQRLCSSLRS